MLLTGAPAMAARNILGENHDVWNVNVERSYHEEFVTSDGTPVLNPSGLDDAATRTVSGSASSSAAAELETDPGYEDAAQSDQESERGNNNVVDLNRRHRSSCSEKISA